MILLIRSLVQLRISVWKRTSVLEENGFMEVFREVALTSSNADKSVAGLVLASILNTRRTREFCEF